MLKSAACRRFLHFWVLLFRYALQKRSLTVFFFFESTTNKKNIKVSKV